MADGNFKRAPVEHAIGAYLDLPLEDYLADKALSGSGFKKLLSDPAGLYWESDDNPLWLKPEKQNNRPRLRGSACHCAVLEGLEVYGSRYVVKPDGVMTSSADLKRWLSAKRQEFIAASADTKLSKEDREAVKQTGDFEELTARVLALDPKARIWSLDDDTEALLPADDQYVRLVERFVRCDPTFAPLVTDGLPEVSIFWEAGGVRFKARIDYITEGTVLDLKTYGQAPRRGRNLREHCVAQVTFNEYDLQAVHNYAAAMELRDIVLKSHGELVASGATATARLGRLREIAAHWFNQEPPLFRWLFLRMGSAPTGISIPFRPSDGQWNEAARQIREAVETYEQFRARFKPGEPWLISHGEQEIQDMDWPFAAIRGSEIEA